MAQSGTIRIFTGARGADLHRLGRQIIVSPLVISLTGAVDIFTAAAARRDLDRIDGPATIDLSSVTVLCAAGLTELVRVANRVGSRAVVLARPQPHVLNILRLVKFDEVFQISSD